MSRVVKTLFAAAILVSIATSAMAANKYPPGPAYRTCPDSVTIFQVQQSDTLLNPCFPALGDTVLGVRGVATAFRLRSTGRIYIETADAADYGGVQVYTVGHLESAGFARGDSVSVAGLSQAYQGESQLQGTLGTSLTVRKINSGNPIPAFRFGTTTDYKWAPAAGAGSAYATCNPREGELVRIEGPLRVARTQAGAGLFAGTNWLLVNSDGSAPGDSIIIDGYTLTLTNISAPPLGYTVNWVQGILRRATNNGVDCWLVTLRDVNDQSVQAPPSLSEAFPIAENQIRLYFDKNVDVATAQNAANYSLGSGLSGSTVDLATVVGGAGPVVDLTITEALSRLSTETISTSGIGAESCPACLSSLQSLSFVLGILTCAEVQAPLADSLAGACLDKSRFAGGGSAWAQRLTVRGVFLQNFGTLYYMVDPAGGVRGGVAAYNVPFGMVDNHQYLLACRVQEYYTESELANPAALIDEGLVTPPAPMLQTVGVLADGSCDASQSYLNAEDYEGTLVRVQNVKVVPFNTDPVNPAPGGSFRVVQRPACLDTILVSSLGANYTFGATVNDVLNINGLLHIDSDVPRILPRGDADIEYIGRLSVDDNPVAISFSVKPNPGSIQRVSFTLPNKAQVECGVYDLQGRRIAMLARGEFPAGSYNRTWDGRTSDGAKVSAGVYFYRLKVGSDVRTLRAVMVK